MFPDQNHNPAFRNKAAVKTFELQITNLEVLNYYNKQAIYTRRKLADFYFQNMFPNKSQLFFYNFSTLFQQ